MSRSRRGLERLSAITRPVDQLVASLRSAVSLLSVSFFLLLRSAKSATAKFLNLFVLPTLQFFTLI